MAATLKGNLTKCLRQFNVKDDNFVIANHFIEGSKESMGFKSTFKKSYVMFDDVYKMISLFAPDAFREFKNNKVVENLFKASTLEPAVITIAKPDMSDIVNIHFGTGKQFKNFVEA